MSNMLDWAKREVDIACKKENPNRKEGEFDYGCACYESALKALQKIGKHLESIDKKLTTGAVIPIVEGKKKSRQQ